MGFHGLDYGDENKIDRLCDSVERLSACMMQSYGQNQYAGWNQQVICMGCGQQGHEMQSCPVMQRSIPPLNALPEMNSPTQQPFANDLNVIPYN